MHVVSDQMRVILEVVDGPRKGRSYVFDSHDTFIVGRSRYVHCPMPDDPALSRDHFLIEVNPPRCEIRDLGSTNGTFLNSHQVARARLTSGDRIAAGQSVFEVRFETDAAAGEATDSSNEQAAAPTQTADAPVMLKLSIACSGCGKLAPANIDIASDTDGDLRDSIHWLCENCRVEAAMTPQPVPHYTTLREIGRGAMGIVYLAQHQQSGRKVALKLIAPETAAARSAIERFLREMSVVSQLKHPNIVEFYEQGTARGRFWFAMEFVDGSSLETLAQTERSRYPIHQACRMASQVLKGLEHAHARGFVHRDIKPENILIGRGETGLIAKISDFGLAKNFRSVGLSGLTFSGEMRGTIPFMPPEQMLDFKKVLPSGDLYATAATLYYLITGEFIFDHSDGIDPIRTLLEGSPVPARSRRREVPRELDAILERCLARDPAERFADARTLRLALRPFCEASIAP